MKIPTTIIASLFFSATYGQELPKRGGCIEIKKVNHHFIPNKKGDPTKEKTNLANRPYLILYLDSTGNVIEKVGYGKQHNSDLRLVDYVVQNTFEDSRLTNSIRYNTDYSKKISVDYNTAYVYDSSNQLIEEKHYRYPKDSIFRQYTYEYDSKGNRTKTIFSPTYYYSTTYDTQNKIQSLKQIYDGKLRWQWIYTYTDSTRVGEFRTYYDDGKDYTKQEIRTYRKGKVIGIEEKYASEDLTSSKTLIRYDQKGIINKIEYYESFSNDEPYKLRSYTEISVRVCKQSSLILIETINEAIEEDE